MSLLAEIRDGAVTSSEPLADLLRRCKILAVRLGSKDFEQWVDRELAGYTDPEDLPDYRVGDVKSVGYFIGSFGSAARNFPIPPSNIQEQWRHHVNEAHMMQPVASYEDSIENKDAGMLHSTWPADLVKLVSQDIYEDLVLVSATQEIPRSLIVALVDAVRNRLLNFVLDLEAIAPAAGEPAEDTGIAPERLQQIFNTNIYGDVANVAAGSQHVTQSAQFTILEGDFDSLMATLSWPTAGTCSATARTSRSAATTANTA